MTMGEFDTTVTKEVIERDDGGEITEIKLKMGDGGSMYIIVCDVTEGVLSFERVSPVQRRGGNITSGGLSFSSGSIKMMDVEKTMTVMRAASDYVDENYPCVKTQRCLWLGKYRSDSDD